MSANRQYVSVMDSLSLSQSVCVCHKQSVCVTYSLFLSQIACVCHTHSVSVTDIFCVKHSSLMFLPGILTKFNKFNQIILQKFCPYLSMRFELVHYCVDCNDHFVDPCPPPSSKILEKKKLFNVKN